jgi:hypothetical protein
MYAERRLIVRRGLPMAVSRGPELGVAARVGIRRLIVRRRQRRDHPLLLIRLERASWLTPSSENVNLSLEA